MSDSKEEAEEPRPPEDEDLPAADPGESAAEDDGPDAAGELPIAAAAAAAAAAAETGALAEFEVDEDDDLRAAFEEDEVEAGDQDEDEDEVEVEDEVEMEDEIVPPEEPQVRLPKFKDMSGIEIASLAGVAILLLGALLGFAFMLTGQDADSNEDVAAPRLKKGVDGELMSVAALETYWKEPGPQDRVQPDLDLVPEVLVRLGTTVVSESAYLKAVFRDEEGTIRGDVTSHGVNKGAFADTSAAEIRIYATDGFASDLDFVQYASGNVDPWTVEIFEGPAYAGSDWNRLAFVTIEAKLRDSATPEN